MLIGILDKQNIHDIENKTKYDITINTHGDIDPYYRNHFSK